MKNTSLLLLAFFIAFSALGQVPTTMNFQGNLTDGAGNMIADGDYAIDFDLFDADVAGNSLWSESQPTVTVINGIFNVKLGSVNPLDPAIFSQQLYLEITVSSEILTPRIELSSSAYSLSSNYADSARVAGYSDSTRVAGYSDSTRVAGYSDSTRVAGYSDSTRVAGYSDSTRVAGGVVGTVNLFPSNGNVYIGGNQDVGGAAPVIDLAIDDDDTGLEVDLAGNLSFYTNGVERIRVDDFGNIGIGTAPIGPSYKFSLITEGSIDNENNWSMYLENLYAGASLAMGIYNYIDGSSTGDKYGYYADLGNSGTGNSWGLTINHFGTTSGIKYGVSTYGEDINYFSGNVGIGTETPPEKLSVSGNIATTGSVEATSYKYSQPRVAYHSINASAFSIAQNPAGSYWMNGASNGVFKYPSGPTAGTMVLLSAPVELPDSVLIKDFSVLVFDANATYTVFATLNRSSLVSPNISELAATGISGDGGPAQLSSAADLDIRVDNENSSYVVLISLPTDSSIYIYGVKIRYTMDEVK